MSGHKSWNEISAKLRSDPERLARIEQREQAIETELESGQNRGSGATQENVAEKRRNNSTSISVRLHP